MNITMKHGPSRTTLAVWLGLGTFFAGLTARVLLWDVAGLGQFTPEHVLTVGALVGAIASGVYFWQMLRAGKLLTAFGLGIAFAGATLYCMIGSAGRGDEQTFHKNAEVRQLNADRARAQRTLEEAITRYEAALDAETLECATGGGARCKARRAATADRRTEREVAETMLRDLPPEGRENGKLKRAAELLAFFVTGDQAKTERGLALLWPFIPPLVCELLTIVFLHLGFSVSAPVSSVPPVPLVPANDPDPEPPSETDRVVSWVREFQTRNGRKPQIPELQARFQLPKTTAWRRIKAA